MKKEFFEEFFGTFQTFTVNKFYKPCYHASWNNFVFYITADINFILTTYITYLLCYNKYFIAIYNIFIAIIKILLLRKIGINFISKIKYSMECIELFY